MSFLEYFPLSVWWWSKWNLTSVWLELVCHCNAMYTRCQVFHKKYLLISTNFQGRIIQTIIHPFYRRSRIFELDTNMAKIWRFSRRNSCPQKYSWLHQLHSHMAVAEPGILFSGVDITNCSLLWMFELFEASGRHIQNKTKDHTGTGRLYQFPMLCKGYNKRTPILSLPAPRIENVVSYPWSAYTWLCLRPLLLICAGPGLVRAGSDGRIRNV